MKLKPDMIIPLVIIVSCVALIATGIDGEVKAILSMAAGWCFRSQYQGRKPSEGGK